MCCGLVATNRSRVAQRGVDRFDGAAEQLSERMFERSRRERFMTSFVEAAECSEPQRGRIAGRPLAE